VAIALLCVAFFLLPQPKPRYKPGEEPNEAEKLKE
jgi:Thrombin inhibitor from mosquito.